MAAEAYTEYIALTKLIAMKHPSNPKDHDLGAITHSIQRFGFVAHPLIDERTQLIVAGHGRIEALEQMKNAGASAPARITVQGDEWFVPVDRGVSFNSDAEVKAYLVADNRLTELGGWTDEALAAVLKDIAADDPDLLAVTGFDGDDLDDLLHELAKAQKKTGDPAAETNRGDELKSKWGVQPGQVWSIGNHRLMCGDSTNTEDVLKLMNGKGAEICITSPPYNIAPSAHLDGYAGDGDDTKYAAGSEDNLKDSEYLKMLTDFTLNALQVCQYAFVNVQFLGPNKLVLIDYLHAFREHFADIAIWNKTQAQPALAHNVMTSAFECVLILGKEKNPSRAIKTARFGRGELRNVYESGNNAGNEFHDLHSATFPTHFASHWIENFSKAGALIYEPFAGTGTTMVAAEQLGRSCYSMELEPIYAAVILQRLAEMGLTPKLET